MSTHRLPPLCHAASPGHLWFRVFGWGLCMKDARRHPLLLSERIKLTGRSIGWLHVSVLRPLRVAANSPLTTAAIDELIDAMEKE